MPLPPVDRALLGEALSPAVFALGESADPDEAFDNAAGDPQTSAAFTTADPGNLQVIAYGLSMDQAISAAAAWAGQNQDSSAVAAFGVVGRSAHSRKTRRLRVESVDLEPNMSAAGRWAPPVEELAAALSAAEGWDVSDEELFESVTYTRRARYKPVVEVNRTKSAAEFIAVDGDHIVTRGHKTAGLARKEAVRLLKERDKDDHELATLDIYKLGGREGGLPLIRICRTRLAQVLTAKVVHATPKSDKPAKTIGWLFVTT